MVSKNLFFEIPKQALLCHNRRPSKAANLEKTPPAARLWCGGEMLLRVADPCIAEGLFTFGSLGVYRTTRFPAVGGNDLAAIHERD
jgi:hypothetical protein